MGDQHVAHRLLEKYVMYRLSSCNDDMNKKGNGTFVWVIAEKKTNIRTVIFQKTLSFNLQVWL